MPSCEDKLKEYARLLVAVGTNLQKGQTLLLTSQVEQAPFARLCAQAAYERGAREVVLRWNDDAMTRMKYLYAQEDVFDETPAWVVHLSTGAGFAEARKARRRGQEVYLESCPQYLVLEEKEYLAADAEKFIMSPPLRSPEDQEALLQAMGQGELDWIGTDHCSFTMAQKAMGGGDFSKVPNGGAGVQNRAEIVYTRGVRGGYITIEQMSRLLSENAARLFGMYPKKGVLMEGSDADIVIFDPNCPHEIHAATNLHHCDNSPYEGYAAAGKTRDVLLKGVPVVRDGRVVLEGQGEYVFRGPCQRYRK